MIGAEVEFVDQSNNDGEYGIIAAYLVTPSGDVRLDKNDAGIDAYPRIQRASWLGTTVFVIDFLSTIAWN